MKSLKLVLIIGIVLFSLAGVSAVNVSSIFGSSNFYAGQSMNLYCNGTSSTGGIKQYDYKIYEDDVLSFEGTLVRQGSLSTSSLGSHSCGIRDLDGRVFCWGLNNRGQLGDGTTTTYNVNNAVLINDTSSYKQVSVGSSHSCGIRSDGRVLCWGGNTLGQLGDGTQTQRNNPTLINDTSEYVKISTNYEHTCGIRSDGRVLCWGSGYSGQIGDGSWSTRTKPTLIYGSDLYSDISVGWAHTCGTRLSDGLALCWGNNDYGQLGTGNYDSQNIPSLVNFYSIPLSGLSAGVYHTCGIYNYTYQIYNYLYLYCWGNNDYGQLGDGTTTSSPNPVTHPYDPFFTKVYSGYFHTCGLSSSENRIKCWGNNDFGQLGDGTTTPRYDPTLTLDSSLYESLSLGSYYTLGIRSSDFKGMYWGYGYYGQPSSTSPALLNTTYTFYPFPSGVSQLVKTLTSFEIGSSWILSCRVKDSTFSDWVNASKSVLNPLITSALINPISPKTQDDLNFSCTSTDYRSGLTPSFEYKIYWNNSVFDEKDYFRSESITSGNYHSCGIRYDGRVLCWGDNYYGHLGDGTTNPRYTPTLINDTSTYAQVSTANSGSQSYHSCGIRSDGRVLCWGWNAYGQLGDGTSGAYTDKRYPVLINDTSIYTQISVGGGHSCGIREDGRVLCWGYNSNGQLGDGTTTQRVNPTLINDTSTYIQISVGLSHSCGIRSDGRVLCWGANNYGQLGDGTTTQRNNPTLINDASLYNQISPGILYTCGIRSDGRVLCWGFNNAGQLGDGTIIQKNSPTLINDSLEYFKISAGQYFTCGIRSYGRVLCWGWNNYGQLGDGTTTQRENPTLVDDTSLYNQISSGTYHTCGIRSDGRVLCWGRSSGALGDGGYEDKHVPTLTSDTSSYLGQFFSDGIKQTVYTLLSGNTTQGDNFTMSCRAKDGLLTSNWHNYSVTILGCPDVTSGGIKAFILKNETTECMRVDTDGDVRVIGGAYFNQGALVPPSDAFILKDSVGNSLFYVNSECNLYTSGNYSTGQTITYGGSDSLYVMRSSDSNYVFKVDSSGNIFTKGEFGWNCETMS